MLLAMGMTSLHNIPNPITLDYRGYARTQDNSDAGGDNLREGDSDEGKGVLHKLTVNTTIY